jgi:hypothetical protein
VSLIRGPVEKQTVLVQDVEATREDSGQKGETTPLKVQVIYKPTMEKVTYHHTDNIGEKVPVEVDAYAIEYRGTQSTWTENQRWFVPELGLVQIDFTLDGQRHTWTLDEIRTLDECTIDGNATPAKDRCGGTGR